MLDPKEGYWAKRLSEGQGGSGSGGGHRGDGYQTFLNILMIGAAAFAALVFVVALNS